MDDPFPLYGAKWVRKKNVSIWMYQIEKSCNLLQLYITAIKSSQLLLLKTNMYRTKSSSVHYIVYDLSQLICWDICPYKTMVKLIHVNVASYFNNAVKSHCLSHNFLSPLTITSYKFHSLNLPYLF